jgi:peptidyl-prolyl cis-trans isomerase A (cyclophilin A)
MNEKISLLLSLGGLIALAGVLSPSALGQKQRKPGVYATFQTSQGAIVIELFEKEAPVTVKNFVDLAEGNKEWTHPETGEKKKSRYYDGTIFHRVIPDFMIQGGDPLGQGTGGPGYKFQNESSPNLKFDKAGRLAMANSGRNTNGSQFFITDVATGLSHEDYTIFGQVIEGLDVVKKIARVQKDPQNKERPLQPVVLEKLTIERVGDSGA